MLILWNSWPAVPCEWIEASLALVLCQSDPCKNHHHDDDCPKNIPLNNMMATIFVRIIITWPSTSCLHFHSHHGKIDSITTLHNNSIEFIRCVCFGIFILGNIGSGIMWRKCARNTIPEITLSFSHNKRSWSRYGMNKSINLYFISHQLNWCLAIKQDAFRRHDMFPLIKTQQ